MSWRPNRPSWRLPLVRRGKATAKFAPGVKLSRFGDGHPSRRQCTAIARTTGERCRRDALQGADRCPCHGGHMQAYRNAPPGFISIRSGPSVVRRALFKLQLDEPFPPGVVSPRSYVERGLTIEMARNREVGLTSKRDPRNQ